MLKVISLKFNKELFLKSIISLLEFKESDEFIIIALVNSLNKIFSGNNFFERIFFFKNEKTI